MLLRLQKSELEEKIGAAAGLIHPEFSFYEKYVGEKAIRRTAYETQCRVLQLV